MGRLVPYPGEAAGGQLVRRAARVYIAGGRGHDLLEFRKRFPDQKGELIIQDQQPVLDSVGQRPDGVEKKIIDFFKEKPVPGARPISLPRRYGFD